MFLLNIPVALSLAVPSFFYLWLVEEMSLMTICARLIYSIDSFPLLAVPFFILAGNLMNAAGVTERIFKFANSLVGHLTGGLAHANIVASIIFSGMSGSALADAAGLGTIEIDAMVNEGYDIDFSAAITGASSIIGPIIPPSIPMVIFAVVAEVSTGRLFIGGIIPGLIMGLCLSTLVFFFAKKRNYPRRRRSSFIEIGKLFLDSSPALFTIVIIIGGIFSGFFTPTEAAAVSVVYVLFLGGVIYRKFSFCSLQKIFISSIKTTSSVIFIVAGASLFAAVITREQIPTKLINSFLIVSDNPIIFLILVNVFLLIIGCFLETIAAINIITPILLPIAIELGINPVHFGVIMVLNLMVGLLTPPFGMILYVLTDIAQISFERVTKATVPFLIPLILVLLLVTFIPDLVLFLVNVVF
jgi:tripartite ATP-independent transporter DctM subunit